AEPHAGTTLQLPHRRAGPRSVPRRPQFRRHLVRRQWLRRTTLRGRRGRSLPRLREECRAESSAARSVGARAGSERRRGARVSSMLRQLAARAGILEGYFDQPGLSLSATDEARIALLRALRLPAETDGDARELLASIEHSELEAIVSPFRLVRQGESDTVAVRLRLTMSERGGARWSAVVRPSQGESAGAAGMKFEG